MADEERLRQLMDQFDFAFGEPATAGKVPHYPFDRDALKRRVESCSPEETAQIIAEVDELVRKHNLKYKS